MPEIHFIRDYFLWAFIPLLIVLLLLFKRNAGNNQWQSVCDPHLLKSLMVNTGKRTHRSMLLLTFIVGSIMILAMAGPSWKKQIQPGYTKKQATVVILDMSSAMSAKDIQPSRLKRAKFKILDLLKLNKDGQTGLIVFSSEAFLVSPLTRDTSTIRSLLSELTPDVMPIDGENISDALNQAAKLIEQSGYDFANILLLTANKATALDITTAQKLSRQNLRISVLGMATELGAPMYDPYHSSLQKMSKLDKTSLQNLSTAGNGLFVAFNNNDSDIKKISAFLKNDNADFIKGKQKVSSWQDDGRLFILLLLPFVLAYFRRGYIESMHA